MRSAVRREADKCCRDYYNLHHLCLRYLIHVSRALLQMLVHSCYYRQCHAADFLQEAFYSEPLQKDSPC